MWNLYEVYILTSFFCLNYDKTDDSDDSINTVFEREKLLNTITVVILHVSAADLRFNPKNIYIFLFYANAVSIRFVRFNRSKTRLAEVTFGRIYSQYVYTYSAITYNDRVTFSEITAFEHRCFRFSV